MSNFQLICRTHDVPPGTGKAFIVNDLPIGIFNIEGKFFAVDDRCPHAGASLTRGILEGESVACRIHHWRFNLGDGKRIDEACTKDNIRCFPVKVVGQEVFADLQLC